MGGRGGTPMDPEAMRAALEALRTVSQVPREFTFTLQPDRVALTEGGSIVTVIPLGARNEDLIQGGVKVLGSAQWMKDGVMLTREFDPTGVIKDTFSLSDEGNLHLRREVEYLGVSVQGTLAYRRKESL